MGAKSRRKGVAVIIAGLDLSLTSTGLALPGAPPSTIHAKKLSGTQRLRHIRDQVIWMLGTGGTDHVYLEGYSYGSRGSALYQIGELGGTIRLAMDEHDFDYTVVPPKSLKTFATGKGNASKDLVLVEAVKRLGYEGSSNDEADAMWLRELGNHVHGQPTIELPKTHLRALEKLK